MPASRRAFFRLSGSYTVESGLNGDGGLAFEGQGDTKFVFQGVHEQIAFGPSQSSSWQPGEPRINKARFRTSRVSRISSVSRASRAPARASSRPQYSLSPSARSDRDFRRAEPASTGARRDASFGARSDRPGSEHERKEKEY